MPALEAPGQSAEGQEVVAVGKGVGLGVNLLPWLFPERVWH